MLTDTVHLTVFYLLYTYSEDIKLKEGLRNKSLPDNKESGIMFDSYFFILSHVSGDLRTTLKLSLEHQHKAELSANHPVDLLIKHHSSL